MDKTATAKLPSGHVVCKHPHRGTCCYVAKKMVAERTPWDALAIGRLA
jgi:hypothetical protein